LIALVATADSDTNVGSYPKALATGRVVDRDIHRSHRNKLACLPCPRKVERGVTTELTGEDSLKRRTLLFREYRAGGIPRVIPHGAKSCTPPGD